MDKIIGLNIETLNSVIKEEIKRQIPYAELVSVLMSIDIEEYQPFIFNKQHHQLLFCERDVGLGIEFHKSTELDGFDIYVWRSIKEKFNIFLRVALAHELAEIAIINTFIVKDHIKLFLTVNESHDMARDFEKRFADEYLGKSGYLREKYEHFATWLSLLSDIE